MQRTGDGERPQAKSQRPSRSTTHTDRDVGKWWHRARHCNGGSQHCGVQRGAEEAPENLFRRYWRKRAIWVPDVQSQECPGLVLGESTPRNGPEMGKGCGKAQQWRHLVCRQRPTCDTLKLSAKYRTRSRAHGSDYNIFIEWTVWITSSLDSVSYSLS